MKDNLPNYLNPHNIDPGRVEPAHIDALPSFDSIRPGQNKCGMPEGAPFDEYGVQIGLAGGEWPKGIQDYAEQVGPFPSDSRLRHFVRHGQPPTMSNADAIEVLKHLEADIYGRIAIAKAIDALIGPWVKTSDRAPTMEDADAWDLVFATHRAFGGEPYKVRYQVVANNPSDHVWWMPIPPLPEVEE